MQFLYKFSQLPIIRSIFQFKCSFEDENGKQYYYSNIKEKSKRIKPIKNHYEKWITVYEKRFNENSLFQIKYRKLFS